MQNRSYYTLGLSSMIPFNEEQYRLIMEAVEDYGMLVDEETSFKCEEVNAIIQAHLDELEE